MSVNINVFEPLTGYFGEAYLNNSEIILNPNNIANGPKSMRGPVASVFYQEQVTKIPYRKAADPVAIKAIEGLLPYLWSTYKSITMAKVKMLDAAFGDSVGKFVGGLLDKTLPKISTPVVHKILLTIEENIEIVLVSKEVIFIRHRTQPMQGLITIILESIISLDIDIKGFYTSELHNTTYIAPSFSVKGGKYLSVVGNSFVEAKDYLLFKYEDIFSLCEREYLNSVVSEDEQKELLEYKNKRLDQISETIYLSLVESLSHSVDRENEILEVLKSEAGKEIVREILLGKEIYLTTFYTPEDKYSVSTLREEDYLILLAELMTYV